jgi:hypothetical protein
VTTAVQQNYISIDDAVSSIKAILDENEYLRKRMELFEELENTISEINDILDGTKYVVKSPVDAVRAMVSDLIDMQYERDEKEKESERQREIDETTAAVQQMCITHNV